MIHVSVISCSPFGKAVQDEISLAIQGLILELDNEYESINALFVSFSDSLSNVLHPDTQIEEKEAYRISKDNTFLSNRALIKIEVFRTASEDQLDSIALGNRISLSQLICDQFRSKFGKKTAHICSYMSTLFAQY